MELIQDEAAMMRAQLKQMESAEDDARVQQVMNEYYKQPQNEIQFDYLYVTPGAPEAGFKEWTRDSILSNYTTITQKKINWCVEEIRILEMMKTDALLKGDMELVANFIDPLIRFNISEKFALENTSRNIDGFNAQTSRSQFNMIQQFRYSEDVERQKQKGLLGSWKLPKMGGGRGGTYGPGGSGYGWESL